DPSSAGLVIVSAWFLLLLQAVMEETVNRAFPMNLWHDRSILFRLLVPATFFVLIHLASEPFSAGRVVLLFTAGLFHGLAFALTGAVWLTSGLHFGANVAAFSVSGIWHAGAIVSIEGRPAFPVTSVPLLL